MPEDDAAVQVVKVDVVGNNVSFSGGKMDATVIGSLQPAAGTFDTLTAKGRSFLTQYTIVGGDLEVVMGEGILPIAMAAADVTYDFGRPLTPNDYILIRSTGQNPYEYIKVGAVVADTVYNITRGTDTTTALDWPANSIWILLGHSGDGRLGMTANGYPMFTVIEQGAMADDYTLKVVLGNITGLAGVTGPAWGLWTIEGHFSGAVHATSGTIDGVLAIGASGAITVDTDAVVIDADGIKVNTDTLATTNRIVKFFMKDFAGDDVRQDSGSATGYADMVQLYGIQGAGGWNLISKAFQRFFSGSWVDLTQPILIGAEQPGTTDMGGYIAIYGDGAPDPTYGIIIGAPFGASKKTILFDAPMEIRGDIATTGDLTMAAGKKFGVNTDNPLTALQVGQDIAAVTTPAQAITLGALVPQIMILGGAMDITDESILRLVRFTNLGNMYPGSVDFKVRSYAAALGAPYLPKTQLTIGLKAAGNFDTGDVVDVLTLRSDGNMGLIGVTNPAARLHLPAGSATAGTAPLKLTSGTVLGTSEPGAIEYDGTHFYGTDSGGTRRQLDN